MAQSRRAVAIVALLSCWSAAQAQCPITASTDIVVYTDNGVGPFSRQWTLLFLQWWTSANPGELELAEVSARNIAVDCRLLDYPNLQLFVLPGGAADNTSTSLGTAGRDNLLDWIYYGANSHFMGTCAGAYYAAGSWWWEGEFYGQPWAPHWVPTVEGPIHQIASYPAFAPVTLSNGLRVLYWGGPGSGVQNTTTTVPGRVVTTYDHSTVPGLPAGVPAVVSYGKLLLFSPHPEAVEGLGISCEAPLPPGCITSEERLANWQFLATQINDSLGAQYVIPGELGEWANPAALRVPPAPYAAAAEGRVLPLSVA